MSTTNWACVGQGSSPGGVCHSSNGTTWANQTVSFSTNNDFFVSSNTLIWDGARFVAASGNLVITSPNGTDPWASSALNTANGNVITFDPVNGIYYVGCTDGNVLQSTTLAGLASATPKAVSTHNIRCAASAGGVTLMGDDNGGMFSSSDKGVTWVSENTGLGAVVLTSLSANL